MKQHRASSLILSFIVWTVVAAMLPLTVAARQRAAGKTEEIVGIVTQTSATSLTINTEKGDRVVKLNAATVIRLDGQPASVSAIAVGDKVEVHAQTETDGSSTALMVDAESHPAVELEGTVKSITATTLTITTSTGDVATNLTSDTRFFVNGKTVTASDIHPGDHVEAEAQEQVDKTLNALVVRVEIDSVHLHGVIAKASTSSITVTTSTGDVVVTLTSSTLIRLDGKVADPSILAVGDRVEIDALRAADQSLTAVTIDVERPDTLSEIEGTVTSVASDHLVVHTKSGDDITIGVTTDTIVRGDDHMLGLADIKTGDQVNVEARVNADSSLTALRIEVQGGQGDGNNNTSVNLTGVIASISSASITVTAAGGKSVVVNISTTTVLQHGSTTLSFSDLKVGNQVEVKGLLNSDGSIAASLIQVEDTGSGGHPEAVDFSGTITAVSTTSVTIKAGPTSATIGLTSTTMVVNGDHPGSVADLKVGQHVEVHANRLADNSLVATEVRIDH
ncbi:MAG TPA: DUF5666 domain-containing protein [Thermoanaerobaculia bacterium]|nr:DUF5666 domain-containing protein [Thermoanaerobaculia bacterium]